VAAQLKQDLGVEADLVVGGPGEFTVWVGDAKVSEKRLANFPEPRDVVAAVRAHAT
jgi:hypothetical protein